MKFFAYCAFIFIVFCLGFWYFNTPNYDFDLQSDKGAHTSLKDFRGKKVLVYFGFTYCPDVCPATLALLSSELNTLDDKNAFLLFISLDPLRDQNISATNEWLRYFYKNSSALIAKDEDTLKKIAKNYGVIYEKIDLKDSAMKYSIAHSNEIFLFNTKGKFKGKINDLSQANLHKQLQNFLAEKD